jgi:hypothetical protein
MKNTRVYQDSTAKLADLVLRYEAEAEYEEAMSNNCQLEKGLVASHEVTEVTYEDDFNGCACPKCGEEIVLKEVIVSEGWTLGDAIEAMLLREFNVSVPEALAAIADGGTR